MRLGRSFLAVSVGLAFALLARPASAEVLNAAPGGFVVQHRAALALPAEKAWARLVQVQSWWSPEHTYSGASRNLSLRLSPGGCFCERLPAGGFAKHAEVVQLQPRKLLRLSGSLGPLQALGAAGALSFALADAEGGTQVTLTYQVGGFAADGLDKLAPLVDQVLGEQLKRLATLPAR
ncbi:MAG TPA: hypothetical protein VMT11_14790 [Myxococcaceae bacterium]|nr:hypothetical protein [Myxococcaceae bacterium]